MERTIEVPLRSLVELLDLAETVVRLGEIPPVLADALNGALRDVRMSILAPV